MVAYAPTEEAPKEQKAKYMTSLNNMVASVPVWEYDFVLKDTNTKVGKRGEAGEEAGSKVVYGRDVLNENGEVLLGIPEDNVLALLNTSFAPPKVACSTRSRALTAAKEKYVHTIS